tara:strand:- start:123 stop:404 length:282 start_codon:yes stop_codon:yes gene_type:complete
MTDEDEKKKRRSKLASQAADLAKTLANASGAKKYRDAGIEAFKGTPVKANDKGLSDSMDITTFHNAYGSRNTNNTGEDMGQMDPEKRKKKYGF